MSLRLLFYSANGTYESFANAIGQPDSMSSDSTKALSTEVCLII